MSTDWVEWHAAYADPTSSLSRRRRSVQRHIDDWLDAHPDAPLRVVSACAGDGRDLLEVLARREDRDRVSAVLLELDAGLAGEARDYAATHGLAGVEVRRGDAGTTGSYAGAVPADLVQMCGVFGNISDDDLRSTVDLLPELCAPGATVIWTRGRRDEVDLTDTVCRWFAAAGFAPLALDVPDDADYRVGVHRLVGDPRPLRRDASFFRFTR